MISRSLLTALVVCVVPTMASAADQTILGNKLLVKNPSTPQKRSIVANAKESASLDTLVGNPTALGATLMVTTNGTTSTTQTFVLPSGTSGITGKPFWSGDAAKGYKYKDSKGENGAVKGASIKKSGNGTFLIKVVVSGKNGTVLVLPPNEGTDGCVLLTINGGDSYSVKFADGVITNKGAVQFKVTKPTSQGTCVTTTTTTTSTTTTTLNGLCSNSALDPGEQCDPPGSSCGGTATCSIDCTCPCESLDSSECMFPYPSDYLTKLDPTTDTGRRVHYAVATMPKNNANVPIVPGDYNLNDGFSPGSSILLHVPNVDLAQTGAVPITD